MNINEIDPNLVEHFLMISPFTLNLFSFMCGMLYTLVNITTWGNPVRLWMHIVIYITGIALYYYIKATFGG